jgi:hypothetical protein
LKRLVILLVLGLAATGCSRFKVLYSLGGEAIQSEAEYYLDLTDEEAAALGENIETLVVWHRSEMLPRYAAFFRESASSIDQGSLDAASVRAAVGEMRTLLTETVEGAAPHVAGVLARHTKPRKLNHLRARMAERTAERRAELEVTRSEWLTERTERSVRRFERFFGDLSKTQMAMVRRYFADTAETSKPWQRVREDRRRAFLGFLAGRPDQNRIAKFLPRILLRSDEIVGPEYKLLADAWWARFTNWMVEMVGSLDAQQRQHFSATLRDYADDMIDLAS